MLLHAVHTFCSIRSIGEILDLLAKIAELSKLRNGKITFQISD
jgi:hypothetical protein